jgi:mannose-6-phosphate isomerase
MDIVKLKPATKDYLWGGSTLKEWGKEAPSERIAECWELSFSKDGPSLIASGKDEGKTLLEVATPQDIGSLPASFRFFPVLIKLIDAAKDLSVQVHPSDEYALKNEGQFGKTEMWYVIDAKPHAGLFIGFQKSTSAEEVRRAVGNGSVMGLLNFREVKPGETYFIKSGTVHAIGAGVLIMEIQQNSTLTYRLYDYGRLDKDGKPRELHLEKALQVLDFRPYFSPLFTKPIVGSCRYFTSSLHEAKGEREIIASPKSFVSITFVGAAKGVLGGLDFKRGDTFFIPAGKKAEIHGYGSYIQTEVI